MDLQSIFNEKLTENGDIAYKSTMDSLLDLLFMSAYYETHLDEVKIGVSQRDKVFSTFMRDPRYGLGRRALGRRLMALSGVDAQDVINSGRYDDLFAVVGFDTAADILKQKCDAGDMLAKKWCPRFGSKDKVLASRLAKKWGMTKQAYGKFIKCDTVEKQLSTNEIDSIEFDKLPSLALLKYWNRFYRKDDTKERFQAYLDSVKKGDKKMHVSTATVYDIYKNRKRIDPDIVFEQLEKISISILPVIDVSGSMVADDALGKAVSIGHYLSKCSSYETGKFVTFSVEPDLVDINGLNYKDSIYKVLCSDWGGNTDLGRVFELLRKLDNDNAPDWICVLSDMEFDRGSRTTMDDMMKAFDEAGVRTRLIWWNFNSSNTTTPVTKDEHGNVFMSGYSPMLLKFLQTGFDGMKFLNVLLDEYCKNINKKLEDDEQI